DSGVFPEQSLYFLFDYRIQVNSKYVLALLNSALLNFYYKNKLLTNAESIAQIKKVDLDRLPIKNIDFTTPISERERLTNQIIAAYDLTDNIGVLTRVQTVLAAKQTDVVHDLLAHLAQQMIDLNKAKQLEIKRFLTWLETKLKIKPNKDGRKGVDTLAGTTGRSFDNFLGDYQKSQDHLPFGKLDSASKGNDFAWFLAKNRNR